MGVSGLVIFQTNQQILRFFQKIMYPTYGFPESYEPVLSVFKLSSNCVIAFPASSSAFF